MSGVEHFQHECQLDVLVFNLTHPQAFVHSLKETKPPGPPWFA